MPASLDHSSLQLLQYAASGHQTSGKAWSLGDNSIVTSVVGAAGLPALAGWKAVVVQLAPGSLFNANEVVGGLALVYRWVGAWGQAAG